MNFKELDEKYPVQYVVMDENTLGYLIPEINHMGILRASVLKGSPHDWMSGSVQIFPSHKIRPATKEDFNDYRVSLPSNFK